MMVASVQLLAGLALLYFGAEWLVKGAAGLAQTFGTPAIVVGLTVVGWGTSAPEMTVSVIAALRGSSALALGNVVGSNIANLGLILGVAALVSPPRTDGRLIVREVPLLLITTAAVPLMLYDGRVSRAEGAVLVAAAVGFTAWLLRATRNGVAAAARADAREVEDAAERVGAPAGGGRPALAA